MAEIQIDPQYSKTVLEIKALIETKDKTWKSVAQDELIRSTKGLCHLSHTLRVNEDQEITQIYENTETHALAGNTMGLVCENPMAKPNGNTFHCYDQFCETNCKNGDDA